MKIFRIVAAGSLLVVLMPAATSAEASLGRPKVVCQASSDASAENAQIGQIKATQIAALNRIDRRLGGLAGQAEAQGQTLTAIVQDRQTLGTLTANLTRSFAQLDAAIAQVGVSCADPSTVSAAHSALTATRAQIVGLNQWYRERLQPDLSTVAGGKS